VRIIKGARGGEERKKGDRERENREVEWGDIYQRPAIKNEKSLSSRNKGCKERDKKGGEGGSQAEGEKGLPFNVNIFTYCQSWKRQEV